MAAKTLKQQLLEHWPDALNIIHEGRCDSCGARALYSFQLPGDLPGLFFDEDFEGCGYWCGCCGFSSAGSRQPFDRREYRNVMKKRNVTHEPHFL